MGLLAVGVAHAVAVVVLDRSAAYVVGWPLLVGAAFVAGFLSPRHWGWWGAVALVPLAVLTGLSDTVIDAGDRGTGSVTLFIVVVQALVATGAALMGAQLAQLGATRGVRESSGRGVTVALALLIVGTVLAVALWVTTDSPDNDPFDSPLFWWLWIGVPVLAGIAGMAFPRLSAWWGFIVVAPLMVLVFVEGRVLYDGVGESFWVIGEVIAFVLAAWATVGSMVGAGFVRRLGRRPPAEAGVG